MIAPARTCTDTARRRRARRADIVLLLLGYTAPVLGACGGGDADRRPARADAPPARPLAEASPARTSAGPPTPGRGAPRTAPEAVADTACPMVGLWRPCSVVKRLERAGFAVTPLPGAIRQPGLAIDGAAYQMGSAELQLFLYADTAAARRQAAAVDAEDARPAHVRGIRRAPAVIHTANLVALFYNNNDRQRERVELALTAGLPAR